MLVLHSKLRRGALLGAIVALGGGQSALAADFILTTDTNVQNGGNILDGGDTLTLNSGVTLDVTASPGITGVEATGTLNTVTHRGTIRTTAGGFGIAMLGTNATVLNFGTVATTGGGSVGIYFGGFGASLTSSGAITTTGAEANGIEIGQSSGADISITGTVDVTGVASNAVLNGSGTSSFFLSGRVTSKQGAALRFTGGEMFVTIDAPAFIEGQIILGNTTVLRLNTGASQSNLWQFDGEAWDSILVTGDVPYVVSGTQFATVDPTQFIAGYSTLSQLGDGIGTMIEGRLQGLNGQGSTPVSRKSSKLHPVLEEPIVQAPPRSNLWGAATGSYASHAASGSFLGYGTALGAVSVGIDRELSNTFLIGMMGGVSQSQYGAASVFSTSQRIRASGGYLGLYGSKQLGKAVLDFSLVGGARAHQSARTVNNNLVVGGTQIASATYASRYITPSLMLRRSYNLGSRLTVTPSVRVRASNAWVDGYTETGSAANLTLSAQRLQMLESRAQLRLQTNIGRTNLGTTLGVDYRNTNGGNTITGTLLGGPIVFGTGTNGDFLAGYFSIDAQRQFNARMSGAISAESTVGTTGVLTLQGKASFRIEF